VGNLVSRSAGSSGSYSYRRLSYRSRAFQVQLKVWVSDGRGAGIRHIVRSQRGGI
jgi:hypothetical protein